MKTVVRVPQQHGAWAFLIVPSLITAFLGGGNLWGFLFFATWICAYPLSFFLTSAIVTRARRGAWTKRARREIGSALIWGGLTSIGAVAIGSNRKGVLTEVTGLAILWCISVYLSITGRERGVSNDLLLVGMASLAPILMFQVAKDNSTLTHLPAAIWQTCLVCFLFFAGTVLHVKSLIREAANRRWHRASVVFHLFSVVLSAYATHSWLIAIPFAAGLLRTLLIRPGIRPGKIGAIEAGLALLLVVAVVLAKN